MFPNFVPLLFTIGSWFHILVEEPCFGDQGEASGVLKGEASVIKAIAKTIIALGIEGAVASVDAVLILSCEVARVTDAATVRRHFWFPGGTESSKDDWSLCAPTGHLFL